MATMAVASAVMIPAIVLGVLGFSALFAWAMWRGAREVERFEGEPKYLRRRLLRGGLLYTCAAVIGTVLVGTGIAPKESLLGLPVVALSSWILFRTASRVKVPPE